MLDVIIIGSGPAGAYCAGFLGLNPHLKTALIEARSFNDPKTSMKSCGGLLSSHAQKELKKNGLVLPQEIKVNPQLMTVDTYDFHSGLRRHYRRSYINMDRFRFETWLIGRIPETVEKYEATRVTAIEKTPQGYRLTLIQNQKTIHLETRILVGADGADSIVRRTLFAEKPQPARYVSLQNRYRIQDEHKAYFGFFDPRITDYYGWALQKDNTLLVGAALKIDGLVHEKFDLLLKTIQSNTTLQLTDLISSEGAIILRPLSLRQLHYVSDSAALIGEASGSISPTSAEGFSFALKSARLLARSLNRYGSVPKALKAYDVSCLSLRFTILFKLLKAPGMYQPWIRKMVMLSGITSTKAK